MSAQLEVPRLEDLSDVGIAIEPSEQLGVVSLTATADDGSHVTLTWDEVAGSVGIRWASEDQVRVVFERETASKVSVRKEGRSVEFHVWSRYQGLNGKTVVEVGETVSMSDVLLCV